MHDASWAPLGSLTATLILTVSSDCATLGKGGERVTKRASTVDGRASHTVGELRE